jgi:hypothetical protein
MVIDGCSIPGIIEWGCDGALRRNRDWGINKEGARYRIPPNTQGMEIYQKQ